jgi:hypothetical protein
MLLCMNAVDGQRGMNEVGEEQVKNRVMDSDLFIYLYEPNIGNCTARKSKKKCSYSFWLLGIAYSLTSIFLRSSWRHSNE